MTAFGVNCTEAIFKSPAEMKRICSGVKSLGATWIRVSARGQLGGSAVLDTAIHTAQAAGLKPIVTLEHLQEDAANLGQAPNFSVTQYGTWCGQLARRYPGVDYEVWNESNLRGFFDPVDAKAFLPYLKSGYTTIKEVAPDSAVALGGLSAALDFPTGIWALFVARQSRDSVGYLQDLYKAGGKGYFDAVAYHPYTYDASQTQYQPPIAGHWGITNIAKLHQVILDNHEDKKIWCTEWGYPTAQVTQKQQTQWLTAEWNLLKQLNFVDRCCLESYMDFDVNNFGLVDVNFKIKDAFWAVKGFGA